MFCLACCISVRYPSVTFFAAELSQIHQFMRRRAFITLLGNAIASPLAARAQATVKLPIIGFLFADPTISTPWIAAFVERLKALDWIEGPPLFSNIAGRMVLTVMRRSRQSLSDYP